ncbi:hypothetical protein JVT61DRAFT_10981 [Boletus reticuloceps]|uniref:Uncharacterized protein n=1 Tax=Boletus reticuloceps TaxID=495285 RepID=A0A8I2YEW0_9AGAM|nr:hypothetical protein JVT61DRAFT_10981 [Boletus reticuloceps]
MKDLAKVFESKFLNINENNHKTLFAPFTNLSLLDSHIHLQFVIFNTGQKLQDLPAEDYVDMIFFLKQMAPCKGDAPIMLTNILCLYSAWTKVHIPANYCNLVGTSKRAHPPSEQKQDDHSQYQPPKCEHLRSAMRSQGQGSQVEPQNGLIPHLNKSRMIAPNTNLQNANISGVQRALKDRAARVQLTNMLVHSNKLSFPFDHHNSSSITDTVIEDNTDWIEYIHMLQKESSDGMAEKWELRKLHDSHDDQLTAYVDEHARTPPSPGPVWDSWKATWGSCSWDPKISDWSWFSSNDWAVFKNNVYLT